MCGRGGCVRSRGRSRRRRRIGRLPCLCRTLLAAAPTSRRCCSRTPCHAPWHGHGDRQSPRSRWKHRRPGRDPRGVRRRYAPAGIQRLPCRHSATMGDPGCDPVRDLMPIGMKTLARHAIFVAPDLPVATLGALIEHTRARPERLNYPSSGNRPVQRIAGALLSRAIRAPMADVPYRGAAPALQDMAGGRMEMFIITPSSAIGLLRGGTLKALVIASDTPIGALPEVPATVEAGLPAFVDAWSPSSRPLGRLPETRSRSTRPCPRRHRNPTCAAAPRKAGCCCAR